MCKYDMSSLLFEMSLNTKSGYNESMHVLSSTIVQ